MNAPNLTSIVKQDVLAELKKGNTDVLKGLPPVLAMQCGLLYKMKQVAISRNQK